MATNSQQLSFAIRAVNEASKALKDVGADIDGLSGKAGSGEKKIGGFGKTLKDVGTIAGGIIAAQGLSKVGGLFTSSVGAASELNEVLSKSNTIFKENAKAIEDWAEGGARDFGLAKSEALAAAGTFGNMFTQLGISTDAAAEMSTGITELAADFASFHNADITSVIEAQSAAFRGEYDSLQRFLPLINAATVEQKALEMTGKATTAELTAQDKALAVHALMLEGAGEAAGDFDRTSGSLANQQRILSAEWENAKAKLGTALLPAMTELLRIVLDEVIPAIQDFADLVGPELEEQFQKFQGYYESDVKPALDNIVAISRATVDFIKEHWGEIEPFVRPIFIAIKDAVDTLRTSIKIIIDLMGGDWEGAWDGIKDLVSGRLDTMKELITTWKDQVMVIVGLVSGAFGGIAGAAESAFNGLMGKVTGIINGLIDAYNSTVGKIPGVDNIPRIGGGGGGTTSTYGVDPGIANAAGTLNPNGTITPPPNGGGALFVPSGATFASPSTAGLPGGGGGGSVNVTVQGSVWSLDELAAELNRRGLVAA